jgi:MoxR-like ATPase
VIIGKRETVELALAGILSQGHLLIEDAPGVGKTMLAKAFALSLGLSFKRIQFTPDLLPADVTGTSTYDLQTGEFRFRAGPIFANVVLADEINRASPKTQSALLECMEESQVTIDGITHDLLQPFVVIATQNPIEFEGIYPLPESQLDRFLLRVRLGYPNHSEERAILQQQRLQHPIDTIEPVIAPHELAEMQLQTRTVHVSDEIDDYVLRLIRETREPRHVFLGASPRGSLALSRVAQAIAALHGRNFVTPDDVKAAAVPALAHRVILRPESRMNGHDSEEFVGQLLSLIPVHGSS